MWDTRTRLVDTSHPCSLVILRRTACVVQSFSSPATPDVGDLIQALKIKSTKATGASNPAMNNAVEKGSGYV